EEAAPAGTGLGGKAFHATSRASQWGGPVHAGDEAGQGLQSTERGGTKAARGETPGSHLDEECPREGRAEGRKRFIPADPNPLAFPATRPRSSLRPRAAPRFPSPGGFRLLLDHGVCSRLGPDHRWMRGDLPGLAVPYAVETLVAVNRIRLDGGEVR